MPTISINKSYRLTTDPLNWRIERLTGVGAKARWESFLFYPTLTSAVQGLIEHRMRVSKANGLEELITDIENFLTDVSRAVPAMITMEIRNVTDSEQRQTPHYLNARHSHYGWSTASRTNINRRAGQ